MSEDNRYHMFVQDHPKTNAGNRKVPISKPLEKILLEYIGKLNNGEQSLFVSNRGNYPARTVFDHKWKNILKKINQFMPDGEETHITSHYFRHNFATDLIYAGVPLKTVQYIMGHKDIKTTLDIYAETRLDSGNVAQIMNEFWK